MYTCKILRIPPYLIISVLKYLTLRLCKGMIVWIIGICYVSVSLFLGRCIRSLALLCNILYRRILFWSYGRVFKWLSVCILLYLLRSYCFALNWITNWTAEVIDSIHFFCGNFMLYFYLYIEVYQELSKWDHSSSQKQKQVTHGYSCMFCGFLIA